MLSLSSLCRLGFDLCLAAASENKEKVVAKSVAGTAKRAKSSVLVSPSDDAVTSDQATSNQGALKSMSAPATNSKLKAEKAVRADVVTDGDSSSAPGKKRKVADPSQEAKVYKSITAAANPSKGNGAPLTPTNAPAKRPASKVAASVTPKQSSVAPPASVSRAAPTAAALTPKQSSATAGKVSGVSPSGQTKQNSKPPATPVVSQGSKAADKPKRAPHTAPRPKLTSRA